MFKSLTALNHIMKKTIFYLFCLFLLSACAKRNLTYFSNLPEQAVYIENIENVPALKIKPDDLLDITVHSLNPEANALFNRGIIPTMGMGNEYDNQSQSLQSQGYLVDQEGFIDFPILGKVKVGGFSKAEAKAKLVTLLEEYLKDPTVNIRYLNYQITVIGEVQRPSTLTISSEKINILEALGRAGDMTPYGKRDNVLVIREEEGVRTIARLNLNNKEVFDSPYFYLQQNDVVYVEPTKIRRPEFTNNLRIISIAISIVSVISLLLIRIN